MSELLSKAREICRLFEIKPARSKGQNFLINDRIYDDIVEAAELEPDDVVLEVGPGLGFLTTRLAKKVKKVIAVELDDRLANYLQMGIDSQDVSNIQIINEDILRFNLDSYIPSGDKYKVVANLPYNITSIFLRQFLSMRHKPVSLVLMLQKEVAERIVATPPDMSLLAVSVQYYSEPRIIRPVKAGNFWPEPEVDSAVIKFDLKDEDYSLDGDKHFFQIVKMAFSAKRKMLKNNVAAGLKIEPKIIENILIKHNFDPRVRAEELSVADWLKLVAALRPFVV